MLVLALGVVDLAGVLALGGPRGPRGLQQIIDGALDHALRLARLLVPERGEVRLLLGHSTHHFHGCAGVFLRGADYLSASYNL